MINKIQNILLHSFERAKLELIIFFRRKESIIFTLLFPIFLLIILNFVGHMMLLNNHSNTITQNHYIVSNILICGLIGSTIITSGFQSTAISILFDRRTKHIKRILFLPTNRASYFLGKIINNTIICVLQIIILFIICITFMHLSIPHNPLHIISLIITIILGMLSCSTLGILIAGTIKNPESGIPILIFPTMILQFISGVFLPFNNLPAWIQYIASIFPLKWICQLTRYALLPDNYVQYEASHSWQILQGYTILIIWCIICVFLITRRFKWH